MNILDFIPKGYANKASRQLLMMLTGLTDRQVRYEINEAINQGAVIISADGGYFVPNLEDTVDLALTRIYLSKERHRAQEVLKKNEALRQSVLKAFEGIVEV